VGAVSLVAPLVNILVVPVIPLVMAFGFVTGVVGIVVPAAAGIFGWATHVMTSYVFSVVSVFSSFPHAAVELPPIPAWVVVCGYVALGILVRTFYKNHPLSNGSEWFANMLPANATPPFQTARQQHPN
jgi:competence protein ComEC